MAQHSSEMYRCIRDLDADAAMRLWKHERPDAPQPENVFQAAMMLHFARTKLQSIPEKLRLYSHSWLVHHQFPSALPDRLKPKAERLFPVNVGAVAVASGAGPGRKTAFNFAVEKVMSDAVLETWADGHKEQPHVTKARILEKRADFKKRA